MRSIVGEATLDEFDLLTLITEIERILNSRPITAYLQHRMTFLHSLLR